MRPVSLQLEGFGSFREPTTVDFEGVDYFALVGPTGSGKSTLIDAIAFALYGSVPRYDDRRLVAPVISQGGLEARVGLDFDLAGTRYRAVRVVRATSKGGASTSKGGASTKEARLERVLADGATEVLAGDADGVSREVQRLLGLGFTHFTKCVVLPQGDFAAFLHDKPADRQDLLVELLGVSVYDRVAAAANLEATSQAARATSLRERLARPPLAGASAEALAAVDRRVADLEGLRASMAASSPAIETARREVEAMDRRLADLAERLSAVQNVAGVPPDLAEAGAHANAAAVAALAAGQAAERCEQATLAAEAARAALPERGRVEALIAGHRERAEVEARLDKGRLMLADLRSSDTFARARAAAAAHAVETATDARETLRRHLLAADVAHGLIVGEPCPVCAQLVAELPLEPAGTPDLSAAESAVKTAARAEKDALANVAEAAAQLVKAETLLGSLEERSRELAAALDGSADAATATLGRVVDAEQALDGAREAERRAREEARRAESARAAAATRAAEVRRHFDALRDGVAAYGPPVPGREDVVKDWTALAAWATEEAERAEKAARSASADRASALAVIESSVAALREACVRLGVPVADGGDTVPGLSEGVGDALAQARAAAEGVRAAIAEAAVVAGELAVADAAVTVARSLAQHLNARNFKKWLLDEALAVLVEGATEVLRELSNGDYSLTVDASGGFAVIDHRNADAVRSARTLSGGETFLTSLALALALADRLAQLAAAGSAPLDAIFLDEGFGTLDPDTLDTVSAAMEGLAATGRVVGLVTHVRELADRVPVRFEVSKDSATSRVRRVEA